MIMCLCLLVYTITQRYLWQQLKEMGETVPNQSENPTKRPTMKWIYRLFEKVHLLIHIKKKKTEETVLNMNPVRSHILKVL
ncbi:MAG: hypothetical protein QRY72_04265 [Candidatus Rhabdochlamydia sp.]